MAFRETERFDAASVSDSLKTFSAMAERVERSGSWSRCVRSFIVDLTALNAHISDLMC